MRLSLASAQPLAWRSRSRCAVLRLAEIASGLGAAGWGVLA